MVDEEDDRRPRRKLAHDLARGGGEPQLVRADVDVLSEPPEEGSAHEDRRRRDGDDLPPAPPEPGEPRSGDERHEERERHEAVPLRPRDEGQGEHPRGRQARPAEADRGENFSAPGPPRPAEPPERPGGRRRQRGPAGVPREAFPEAVREDVPQSGAPQERVL